jgi:DNA-binding transcriptional ArsR family regulator
MATNQQSAAAPSHARSDTYSSTDTSTEVSSEEYLELLGDDYTRRILNALIDEPRTGREIMDATDISKPTVYRRLQRLEDAGLVAAEQRIDLDGHHCKQFRAVVETIDFEFDENGIHVSLDMDPDLQSSTRSPSIAPADD